MSGKHSNNEPCLQLHPETLTRKSQSFRGYLSSLPYPFLTSHPYDLEAPWLGTTKLLLLTSCFPAPSDHSRLPKDICDLLEDLASWLSGHLDNLQICTAFALRHMVEI
jgi:hypothetical protein